MIGTKPAKGIYRKACGARRLRRVITWLAFLSSDVAFAGAAPSSGGADSSPEGAAGLPIEAAFLPSVRADGMAGALGPVADDVEAASLNPAGIGGEGASGGRELGFKKFYMPMASGSVYGKSLGLLSKVGEAQKSREAGKAVVAKQGDGPQFGRASLLAGFVFGRVIFVPFSDLAVSEEEDRTDPERLTYSARSVAGLGLGFSFEAMGGRLAVGYFGSYQSLSLTSGSATYDELAESSTRSKVIAASTSTFKGLSHGVGLTVRPSIGPLFPALSLMASHVGGDHLHGGAGVKAIDQQIDASAAVSPFRSTKLHLSFSVVEEDMFTTTDRALLSRRLRAGVEAGALGLGSYATAALRAGWSKAGLSTGAGINLGLVTVDAARSQVFVTDSPEETRTAARYSVQAAVNLASP